MNSEKPFDRPEEKQALTSGCPFHSVSQTEPENCVLPGTDRNTRLTPGAIPPKFMEWLVSSRVKFLDNLIEGQPMLFFSAHLPTMITWGTEGEQFPVNMTTKGIGLIPKKEHLQHFTELFEETGKESLLSDWDETLPARIDVTKKLYHDIVHFEPFLLGGLEIFEGKAYENLKENPNTSLLYVGMMVKPDSIEYISFQVNGEVELLEKDNPYYKYLLSSRKLFEFDKFHLFQPDYPFGYLIRVKEVRDKSPFTRKDTGR